MLKGGKTKRRTIFFVIILVASILVMLLKNEEMYDVESMSKFANSFVENHARYQYSEKQDMKNFSTYWKSPDILRKLAGKIHSTATSTALQGAFTDLADDFNSDNIKTLTKKRLEEREAKIEEIYDFRKTHLSLTHLPKVIGIGVKKCGTGGLITFLAKHPLIRIPKIYSGETSFFVSEQYKKGPRAYRSYFPPTNEMEFGMEKTPIYFDSSNINLASTMKKMVPKAKILLMVCDPTMRSFSDYNYEKDQHPDSPAGIVARQNTFEEFIDTYVPKMQLLLQQSHDNRTSYADDYKTKIMLRGLRKTIPAANLITTGLYIYHIQTWKTFYDKSNFLIVDGEEFIRNTGAVIEQIQEFLGIPKLVWKEDFVKHPDTGFYCYRKLTEKHLNSSYVETDDELRTSLKCLGKTKGHTRNGAKHASPEALGKLSQFYELYNRAFYQETGKTYNWL
ncbi:heparan sulfate glucosamine 3-O-sulfotransferase 6-like isoform X2 [Clavelina lepadiformis]|uniref:heparan sulfate glucosamine 3-O-sulfotransferase 6-like isoform X2 n=1 Tax=Clavelina lepadiformis TaxID=159417 RepID=UPI0040428BED